MSALSNTPSNRPTFTIVTVCRNAEATITRAMESVLAQGCDDYEYLVIDGASTDKTGECVQRLAPAFGDKLHYTSEPDDGIYDAMNKGLAAARGEFIAFLNADDWYEPDTLATVAALVKPGIDCVGGAIRIHPSFPSVGTDRQTAGAMSVSTASVTSSNATLRSPRPELLRRSYPPAMPAGHQSWFARTALLREVGGFDTRFRIAADYDLFLRLRTHNSASRRHQTSLIRTRTVCPLISPKKSDSLTCEAVSTQEHPSWVFTPKVLSNFTLGGTSYALVETAREYRLVKRANGDTLTHAWIVYARNILASLIARQSTSPYTGKRNQGA